MNPPHVAAISGSLREQSYTTISLEHALDAAETAGATTELIDLREYDLPLINPDEDEPDDVKRMIANVREADAIILGTPVYHGSYSSPLKTALDYCGFDEFEDTTVGLLAVAGGSFPVSSLEHLRTVCRTVNAWVLPHQAAIPNVRTQFEAGEFRDDQIAERVHTLGQRVVEYANIEPEPPWIESTYNEWPGHRERQT